MTAKSSIPLRMIIAFMVLGLYVPACFVPAVELRWGGEGGPAPGGVALMFGWFPPFTIPWSANILLLVALIQLMRGREKAAAKIGLAAAILALTAFAFVPIYVGYFLWQAAMITMAVGAWWLVQWTAIRSSAEL